MLYWTLTLLVIIPCDTSHAHVYPTKIQNLKLWYYKCVKLMDVLRTIVNKLFKESFHITLIGNIKSCKKLIFYLLFFHKKFLKVFYKLMLLAYLLTFSIKNLFIYFWVLVYSTSYWWLVNFLFRSLKIVSLSLLNILVTLVRYHNIQPFI